MNRECISCNKLGRCGETSTEKVESHYYCPVYEAESDEKVLARVDITNRFGHAGIKAMVGILTKEP